MEEKYKICSWCGGDCIGFVNFAQGKTYCSNEHWDFDRKASNPQVFGELTEQQMRTRDMNKKPVKAAPPVEVVVEEFWDEDDDEDAV